MVVFILIVLLCNIFYGDNKNCDPYSLESEGETKTAKSVSKTRGIEPLKKYYKEEVKRINSDIKGIDKFEGIDLINQYVCGKNEEINSKIKGLYSRKEILHEDLIKYEIGSKLSDDVKEEIRTVNSAICEYYNKCVNVDTYKLSILVGKTDAIKYKMNMLKLKNSLTETLRQKALVEYKIALKNVLNLLHKGTNSSDKSSQ